MSIDFKKFLNCYEFETTLPGSKEVVKFKPITTLQMKKLLTYENETRTEVIEKALDELITSSVTSDNFDIKKLFIQDRFYLLLEIRRKTNGDIYKFTYTCDECGSQQLESVDLSKLKLIGKPENLINTIKVNDDLSINLSYITREKQEKALDYVAGLPKDITGSARDMEASIHMYALCIDSITTPDGIDTNLPINDKRFIIENIPKGIFDEIRNWYTDNNFGIEFSHKVTCTMSNCLNEKYIDLPLDNFFF